MVNVSILKPGISNPLEGPNVCRRKCAIENCHRTSSTGKKNITIRSTTTVFRKSVQIYFRYLDFEIFDGFLEKSNQNLRWYIT